MSVAAPNQTHLKILASVLHLESFTIAELCLHAGLERSMVYRELAALQDRGVLTSNSSLAEGESRPRHCPPKRYELSPDPQRREQLEAELGSFLPDFEDPQSNRHLRRAQEVLSLVSVDLLAVRMEDIGDAKLDTWEEELKRRLEEAQKELQRATWESETDFSEGDVSSHPITLASRLYDGLQARFGELVHQERSRRQAEAARKNWADIFTSALRTALPRVSAAGSSWATPVFLADLVNFQKVSAILSQEIHESIEGSWKSWSKDPDLLRPFFSSFELDVREAASKPDFLAVLAKHGIAYGSSAEEPLAFVRELKSQSADYRLIFDESVLAHLAEQPAEAYKSWIEYLSKKPALESEGFEQPVVGRISAERWSPDAYRQAVQTITKHCKASVAVLSETPFGENEGFAVALKLYNPVRDKSEQQTPLIPIGDPLVQAKRLYVITTEAEQPTMLGLPSFACAAWFRRRVGERRAWDLAGTVEPTERIVKVEFFRGATAEARIEVERVLVDSLSAELIR